MHTLRNVWGARVEKVLLLTVDKLIKLHLACDRNCITRAVGHEPKWCLDAEVLLSLSELHEFQCTNVLNPGSLLFSVNL